MELLDWILFFNLLIAKRIKRDEKQVYFVSKKERRRKKEVDHQCMIARRSFLFFLSEVAHRSLVIADK